MITSLWSRPATIERNNFKHKSLSCWSYNVAVGCEHACRFCYVPQVSTNRMASKLATLGVKDPDAEWGQYVFPRMWDESAFNRSLRAAMDTPLTELNPDGNRAIMLCTTTDPYQALRDLELRQQLASLVRFALRGILEFSDLNVRILTRSPLARQDFDLMKAFGNRLLFGMSLPTLNNQLARIYEPHAPAPTQRLATLRAAKEAGLNIFVAVAPTYPECGVDDLHDTLEAVAELEPYTVFHEPINIRADNVARIADHAKSLGVTVKSEVFASPEKWRAYAVHQFTAVAHLCDELGITCLHPWPDQSLGSRDSLAQFEEREIGGEYFPFWLDRCWSRISDWPE